MDKEPVVLEAAAHLASVVEFIVSGDSPDIVVVRHRPIIAWAVWPPKYAHDHAATLPICHGGDLRDVWCVHYHGGEYEFDAESSFETIDEARDHAWQLHCEGNDDVGDR